MALFGRTPLGLAVGVVIVFTWSGILHVTQFSIGIEGRRLDWQWRHLETMLFFELQGGLILGEQLFERISGHAVGGIVGRVWTWTVIIGSSSLLARTWLDTGIADRLAHPFEWQPWRWLVPFGPFL